MASSAPSCSSTPFRSKPSESRWFRIPAVVRTPKGTLVAFAERRDRDDSDLGNFEIVTARSTDHGCTWSPYRVIGNDASNRVSNPTPVVDTTTGKIFLFSGVTVRPGSGGRGKGLYLQTSSDDGRTFTPLLSRPIRPSGAYKGGLPGPGHGIQLRVHHKGRLIIPMGYRTSAGYYGAYGIYSDDHGSTWRVGFDQQDTTGNIKLIEGTIAEQADGELFISYRVKRDGAKAGTVRRFARSSNGGTTLSRAFRLDEDLPIVSVQGSALGLTGIHSNKLLFSAPADRTPTLRRDMTIFVSRTRGDTWGRRYQVELESTPGSYSDLVQVDAGTVGVLYETGIARWKERIAFESVAIPALSEPPSVPSSLSHLTSSTRLTPSVNPRVRATVRVAGISSPPGRVTLTATRPGTSRSASVLLTYSNQGTRWITLPRLARGTYTLILKYGGTGRIKPTSRSAGTIRVW